MDRNLLRYFCSPQTHRKVFPPLNSVRAVQISAPPARWLRGQPHGAQPRIEPGPCGCSRLRLNRCTALRTHRSGAPPCWHRRADRHLLGPQGSVRPNSDAPGCTYTLTQYLMGQFTNTLQNTPELPDRSFAASGVAQRLACWAHNPKVRGSKPRSAILKLGCSRSPVEAATSLGEARCWPIMSAAGFEPARSCLQWILSPPP